MGRRGSAALAVVGLCVGFAWACGTEEGRRPVSGPDGGTGGRPSSPEGGTGGQGTGGTPEDIDSGTGGAPPSPLVPEALCPARVEPSGAPTALPALSGATPADAATDVPRTAWVRLDFGGKVSAAAARHVTLDCGAGTPDYEANVVGNGTVVLNPCGMFEPDAECRVRWKGESGDEQLSFTVAAGSGAAATVRYDRNDTSRLDPFPDDFYLVPDPSTRTGQRVDIRVPEVDPSVKGLLLAGTDGVKKLDGMSPLAPLIIALPEAVDASSLPLRAAASLDPLATAGLFDIDDASDTYGERVPFDAMVRNDTNAAMGEEHILVVFPSVPLRPRGKYAFALTNRALVTHERPLLSSAAFQKVLGGALDTPDEQRLAVPLARVVRELARTSPPLRTDDLALALGVSVRSVDDIPNDLLAIREQLHDADPPTYTVSSVAADATPESDVAAILRGTFSVPSFRNGDFVRRDAAGKPVSQGTDTIGFTLALPKAALTARVPVVFYQHGQPGNAEDEVPRAASRGLAKAGFAVVGFTDVANRVVIPDGDIIKLNTNALFSFLGAHDMPDYLGLLAHAEQLAFLRLIPELKALDVLPVDAPDGVAELDTDKPLAYLGISQGSVHGVGLLAFAPEIHAAALTAGGGRLSATLMHQAADPLYNGIAALVPALKRTELYAGFALVQMVYDRQDPLSLGRYLYREPLDLGTERRASVLLTEGLGDTMVPLYSTRAAAMQLGLPQLAPHAEGVPFLENAAGPLQGNMNADTTGAFFQYVPMDYPGEATPSAGCVANGQKEGHYCAQTAAEAIAQRVEFFTTALAGVPRVIDATP